MSESQNRVVGRGRELKWKRENKKQRGNKDEKAEARAEQAEVWGKQDEKGSRGTGPAGKSRRGGNPGKYIEAINTSTEYYAEPTDSVMWNAD